MKLSILIPCFNKRNTIEEILSRLEACAHQAKEIIIIDNSSPDGTREILVNVRPATAVVLPGNARI